MTQRRPQKPTTGSAAVARGLVPRSGDPDATIRSTIAVIGPLDVEAMATARRRLDRLTKPPRSLGRLEDLATQVAGITGDPLPALADRVIVTCAGDHGVTAEGVSAYPAAVTAQMVYNFVRGGAAINVLARRAGARIVVADLGVDHDFPPDLPIAHVKVGRGTANFAHGPAMSRDDAARSISTGIGLVEQALGGQTNQKLEGERRHSALSTQHSALLFGTGDMGIGNTTASSAIVAAITGAAVSEVTGRGTGIDDAAWERKVAVIERALAVNRPDASDGLDVLAKVGGYEIGGIAGVILGAAAHRCPVVIDGFISGAGALVAATLCPAVCDYLIPAHVSVEAGHRVVLHRLGLTPLLALDLRLGEGTGAALAMMLVDAALAILREMATFAKAGVSGALQQAVELAPIPGEQR